MGLHVVIPAFHPPESLVETVATLAAQHSRVVVVDDGSGSSSDLVFEALRATGARVVRCDRNQGIASALNLGVCAARADGAEFVATLDQDSVPPEGYLARAQEAMGDDPTLAAVVPEFIGGWQQPIRRWGRPEPLEPIQSGAVFRTTALARVGSFREDFFIDCVDTEYFLRLRRAGLRVRVLPGADLQHRIGEPTWIDRTGREEHVHTPQRWYYIARNRLVLLMGIRNDPEWWFRSCLRQSRELARQVRATGDAESLLLACRLGVWDALRRRMGRIPDSTGRRLRAASEPLRP